MDKKTVVVETGLHVLAIAQARSLAKMTRLCGQQVIVSSAVVDVLSYLVMAGISIELYFKSLMIAGRSGRVTKGHELDELYAEFPEFMRVCMENHYSHAISNQSWDIKVFAIIQSKDVPKTPEKTSFGGSYLSFGEAISALNNIFVRARYFFEKVNSINYAYFDFPVDPVEAVFDALDHTYDRYIAGALSSSAIR